MLPARAPDGRTIPAPSPDGIAGLFGPELQRFVLMQYHQGQTTVPRLLTYLRSLGLSISKRQLERRLTDRQDAFVGEAQAVLRAGMATSPFVSVDDTGARHAGKNGFCTQIGNDWFTWFGTRSSKSRLNFLDLLRAGHTDYGLSEAAFAYLRGRGLSGSSITGLAEAGQAYFADQAAWQTHLCRDGIVASTKPGLAAIQDVDRTDPFNGAVPLPIMPPRDMRSDCLNLLANRDDIGRRSGHLGTNQND